MIRELVHDDSILSQPCEVATAADADIAQDLLDTLASLDGAACLAANQIGETKAVIVYLDDADQPHVMFNPRTLLGLNAFKTVEECFTHEGASKVTRFDRIKVTYEELVDGTLEPRKRDFTGRTAQGIQHMIDHCRGKLV